jgi:glycosyltransferase involved in cell wall biosynthesis
VPADVALLVEGTYPYIEGGVASWMQSLVTNLPDISFSIVHVGSTPEPGRQHRYALPANVVDYQEIFIHDPRWIGDRDAAQGAWRVLNEYHQAQAAGSPYDVAREFQLLAAKSHSGPTAQEFFYGPEGWNMLVQRYQERAPNTSFMDFFWTFRFTHLPVVSLLEAPLPDARIYHSVSAGFNSFFGAIAKMRTGAPLLLTEHGIYTKEREIEIAQAPYIEGRDWGEFRFGRQLGFFQEWWISMFRFMAKLTYDLSDQVISITAANQYYQLKDGADPRRMLVIPNGIALDRFGTLRRRPHRNDGPFQVGLVGRVVPIKDVKTFIRAVLVAKATIPDLKAYVVGPVDEDKDYVEECKRLVAMLGLKSTITFTGRADVREYYKRLDAVVLTSLSEAQPLVILEANSAGLPAIATDVGGCRELIEGGSPPDRALGSSGLLVAASSPEATAEAMIKLWRSPTLRTRLAEAGRERVERFYREEAVYNAYRSLYGSYLESAARKVG